MSQTNKKTMYNQKWFIEKGYERPSDYLKELANKHGFENWGRYARDKGWIPPIKDEWRVLDEKNNPCPTATPIPGMPGYFITPMGEIWKRRNNGKWIEIKQQSHKSGYKAFQPYIDGKRCVKYVHRTLCSAFYGERDADYEAHHINGDKHDNTIGNLMWMERDSHRRLKRGKYKKRGGN